jgi:SAM-dependent methyltransferase
VLHRTDQDVGFWLERANETGGPVLELACGTGRLTVPLAAQGLQMVGLDNDRDMLASAEQRSREQSLKRGQGEWPIFLVADMRRFALAGRFPLIFIGYNSLQLLTAPGDMVACLRSAREHLEPGGLVGVEVTDFQHGGADGPEVGGSPQLLAEAKNIRLTGTLVHDLAARTSRYRRHFAGPGWNLQSDVIVRSVDLVELEALFAEAELSLLRWWHEGATVRAVATVAALATEPPSVSK